MNASIPCAGSLPQVPALDKPISLLAFTLGDLSVTAEALQDAIAPCYIAEEPHFSGSVTRRLLDAVIPPSIRCRNTALTEPLDVPIHISHTPQEHHVPPDPQIFAGDAAENPSKCASASLDALSSGSAWISTPHGIDAGSVQRLLTEDAPVPLSMLKVLMFQ